MKFYYVYILLCSGGTYYTGMTNDLERRILQHKSGYKKDSYTFSRRPIALKSIYNVQSQLKPLKLKNKFKAGLNENRKDLIEFSKNYAEYGHPDNRE